MAAPEEKLIMLVEDDKTKNLSLVYYCPACATYHSVTIRGKNEAGSGPWTWNCDEEHPIISPSVVHRRKSPKGTYICHHYVEGGKIRYLNDCTHEFRGKTIPMETA